MSEHTKEPWRVGRPGTVVADEPVPDMGGSDDVGYYGGHMVAESVTGANARRIVACVNACEGVPTELLEAYPAPFSELRAERDRLLTALKVARRELKSCQAAIYLAGGFDPAYVIGALAAVSGADAAIASVKGEAA